MGIFGDLTGDQVFGTGATTGGVSDTAWTGGAGTSWVDRVFSTGTDFVSQYVDFAAKQALARQNNSFQLAAMNQANLIGNTELPQNVGAQVMPLGQSVPSIGGVSLGSPVVMIAVVGLIAYLALK